MAFKLRSRIDFRLIIPALLGYFVTNSAVIFLSAGQPDSLYKKVLAVALILMSAYFFLFNDKIRIRASTPNSVIAGALSGILGGLFGMSGPPIAAFMISVCADDSQKYLANMQFFLAAGNFYASVMRVLAGLVNSYVLTRWSVSLIVVMTGVYIGQKMSKRISAQGVRKIVYSVMAGSGVLILLQ